MRKWLLHIIYIGVTGILALSCTNNFDEDFSPEEAKQINVTFTLAMDAPLSRAAITEEAGSEYENRIDANGLQVLFYSEEDGTCLGKVKNVLAIQTKDNHIYQFTGSLNLEGNYTDYTLPECKVMVFANCPTVVNETSSATDLSALSFGYTPEDYKNESKNIPMWGVASYKNLKLMPGSNTNLETIHILRAMAKVEVSLSNEAAAEFSLTGVSLNKYNTKGNCLPAGYNDVKGTNELKDNVSKLFNASSPLKEQPLEFKSMDNKYILYLPECAATDNPFMTVSLTDKKNNTEVQLNEPHIYFKDYEKNEDFDIVRNYCYRYTIGKIENGEMQFSFHLTPWAEREVNIDVDNFQWLWVKDDTLYMNNVNEISTIFDSSAADLKCTISDVRIFNQKTEWETGKSGMKASATQSLQGKITIESPVPDNFVGKEFKVTVESSTSKKKKTIQVYQFPPLYITLQDNDRAVDAGKGQTNSSLYEIRALLADFSTLPTNTEEFDLDEDWDNGYSHQGTLQERQKKALNVVKYLQSEAKFGYPQTEQIQFKNFYSTIYNTQTWISYVTAWCTIENEENSHLISPHFILASQGGANNLSDYDSAKKNCAGYYEIVKNADGKTTTTYGSGTWRMPTRAELELIDFLQNIKKAKVKKILEGPKYQHAMFNGSYWYSMMDRRISNTQAVRCVRDIK